jgi:hypothetical protein
VIQRLTLCLAQLRFGALKTFFLPLEHNDL